MEILILLYHFFHGCVLKSEDFLVLYQLASATKSAVGHDSALATATQCLQKCRDIQRHESCLFDIVSPRWM
jgi:hypothetical protein